jgi:hypothetical protein
VKFAEPELEVEALESDESDDIGLFNMNELQEELRYFEKSEMNSFMRLNILVNKITTESFRQYLQ